MIAEDGAALVFTQYVAMAPPAPGPPRRAGLDHQFLHGGTPVRERRRMVDRFQAGEARSSCSRLKAGGTGLNLTRADHVVHFDRWWNPAVEEQATDRAYRIGQTRPVQVHRLITEGTVEDRIAELLEPQAGPGRRGPGPGRDRADRAEQRRPPGVRVAAPGRGMTAVSHARIPVRRGATRATTWWGKAWVRAVEESAYSDTELRAGRQLARSGRIGSITVRPGGFVAAVEDPLDLHTVSVTVPVLDAGSADTLVELVAAEAGRIAALLSGDLPHRLVEEAEDSGVELLPFGGELGAGCSCASWVDPCAHALAVAYQLAWLVDADPLVLLALRGLPREDLLARLHARGGEDEQASDDEETALEASLRAASILERLDVE